MESNLLNLAKTRYKRGTMFISPSGNVLESTGDFATDEKGNIYCSYGHQGVVYDASTKHFSEIIDTFAQSQLKDLNDKNY